ncbi:MAG: addiction module antidote protein, HigA family [Hymenobacter sp.]|nr:MAG: addiction module antidote protein, HigA family [Hymenobacter sp.]
MNHLPSIHPGEVLREEFLHELAIGPERLAHDLRLPLVPVTKLLSGQTRLTADTALRLSRYFGNSPKFWLGLQNDYDLEKEQRAHQAELDSIRQITTVA